MGKPHRGHPQGGVRLFILQEIGSPIGKLFFNPRAIIGPTVGRIKGNEEPLNKPLPYKQAVAKADHLYRTYGLRTRVVSIGEVRARQSVEDEQHKRKAKTGYHVSFKNPLENYAEGLLGP